MFGKRGLAPGAQGGGPLQRKKKEEAAERGTGAAHGPSRPSSGRASSLGSSEVAGAWHLPGVNGRRNDIEAAINKTRKVHAAQSNSSGSKFQLPDWIQPGLHVGYMSQSSGKLCEVIVEKVSRIKQEVKIVFAEDKEVWKCIPFSMIASRSNPLRQLAQPSAPRTVNDMLNHAQASKIDKSVLFRRVGDVGSEATAVTEQLELARPLVPEPLVGTVGQKAIPDSSITASSYFMNSPRFGLGQMWCSRIDSMNSAWRPASDSVNQCILWDLGGTKQVTKIQTKGSFVEEHWVTSFHLSYSLDGRQWTRIETEFQGNADKDTLMENLIDPPIVARKIKLHPTAWHQHVGLRAEFFGFAAPEDHAEVIVDDPDDAAGLAVASCAPAPGPQNREADGARSRSPHR